MDTNGWIDLTVPLHPDLTTWPGDPPLVIERHKALRRGDGANLTALQFGAHAGTHVDAPLHFIDGAPSVEEMPLDLMMGPARVVHLPPSVTRIDADILSDFGIQAGERILLRTRNSDRLWSERPFDEDFTHITPAGADYLARHGVRLVGIDHLSIGGYAPEGGVGPLTHRILLASGAWIVEGLDLRAVPPGPGELLVLPLRLRDGDGAPARALFRPGKTPRQ